jgi:chemotaxis protein histidine kinase CheA/ActR/RegA family two-component response regulator
MSEAAEVDISVIRDTVLSAQEAISEVLKPLRNSENAESITMALSDVLEYLENIGVIADMFNLKGLNTACTQFSTQLLNQPLANQQDIQLTHETLNNWLLDILMYLDDWKSEDNIELLISTLTDNTDDIRHQLVSDTQADKPFESIPDTLDENYKFETEQHKTDHPGCLETTDNYDEIEGINPDTPEGIMGLYCDELRELQPQISQLLIQISSKDKAIIETAVASYIDIIERIQFTSEELDLSGIALVCKFVIRNLSMIVELDYTLRNTVKQVLESWPQVIIEHLQNPQDDKLCLAVVDYLENESWPDPLKYSETRNLIDGLTRQLELTGDYEVEVRSTLATDGDVSLDISSDTSQQLHDAFFAEAPGQAEELTLHIAAIVNGEDVLENTKAAQRISHTLKGSANLISTKGIANLAHHLEDIFEYLVKQSLPPPQQLAYTIQEAADTIEVMIESLQGLVPAPDDAKRILQDVLDWANHIDSGDISLHVSAPTVEKLNADNKQPKQPDTTQLTQTELLRVPRDTIDQIFNLIGETSIAIGQIQEQLKRMHERSNDMRKQETTLQSRRFELENLVSIRSMASQQKRRLAGLDDDKFDSLEMDQYDEFYGATHTFIEAVSDTREASRDVNAHIMELDGLFLKQQRLNRALQDLVVTTRMVPVKTIVARLQRTVRQACRSTGKQAELEISGDSLLMDGDVLNQLADPLMHLLRNAIDHGIEAPEKRLQLDKPQSGQIKLHFYQEGNSIKVNCTDDGAGLDYEQIRWTGIDKNLINTQEEIENSNLARLILNSGFSTRDKATQISGRGVGMDVVNTAITNLKGNIDISDNQPCGTRFNLNVPITLLTSHSILVNIEDGRYAIPTSMLEQILPPGTGQYSRLNDKLTFQLGKDVYPARSLLELLGMPLEENNSENSDNTVLLVRYDREVYAVMVDYVVSSYDLVVKSLGRYVKHIPGITGVALLGDGGVVPVLDMPGLLSNLNSDGQNIRHEKHIVVAEKSKLAKVLIVDDSLSVRKSLSQLVQDAGYEPIVVRDGIEALEVMQRTMPDLILTDLEMPRMNGLELATHVRSDPGNKSLPIMMITSRTMNKHQEQAQKAGINEYITKPFSEDDLVEKLGVAING